MAQTYFCMSCGNENPIKLNKCECGAEKDSVSVVVANRTPSVKIGINKDEYSGPKLGDKFDFSIFESMAADMEKEVGGLGDEKDLGKWGGKTIEGLEFVKNIIDNKNK